MLNIKRKIKITAVAVAVAVTVAAAVKKAKKKLKRKTRKNIEINPKARKKQIKIVAAKRTQPTIPNTKAKKHTKIKT